MISMQCFTIAGEFTDSIKTGNNAERVLKRTESFLSFLRISILLRLLSHSKSSCVIL